MAKATNESVAEMEADYRSPNLHPAVENSSPIGVSECICHKRGEEAKLECMPKYTALSAFPSTSRNNDWIEKKRM